MEAFEKVKAKHLCEDETPLLLDLCEIFFREGMLHAAEIAEDAYIVLPVHDKRFQDAAFSGGCEFSSNKIREAAEVK